MGYTLSKHGIQYERRIKRKTSMKKVTLLFITDGRTELLKQTMKSFFEKVKFPYESCFCFNDNPNQSQELLDLCNTYGLGLITVSEKKGLAGIYNFAFSWLKENTDSDYYFCCEDDFLFNEEINIESMIDILEYDKNICQVRLKRQPWSEEEIKVGGFVEQNPDAYEDKKLMLGNPKYSLHLFCTHREIFSLNPNLAPRWIIEREWKVIEFSEYKFSEELFAENPNYKCALLGHKFDPPKVKHIGYYRSENAKLY